MTENILTHLNWVQKDVETLHNMLLTYSMAQQPLESFDRPLMRVYLIQFNQYV
jgi:hypothetical protein